MTAAAINSSSTEAGVLMAITGHGPTPPEGDTYYHWRGVTRPPPEKREPAYLSGEFSSTYMCSHQDTSDMSMRSLRISKRVFPSLEGTGMVDSDVVVLATSPMIERTSSSWIFTITPHPANSVSLPQDQS
ncbi:hypothetical protein AVEN_124659-1 [Araneus ventricosus]|uniref:Uncharacterized protein n=1 Tax=Araneus ventricosus TaxID=182803 RepID=A0A4Y2S6U3_ARAVE|nr:hypothetical protein AVEN_124659-1 [Araneus ventricosus]